MSAPKIIAIKYTVDAAAVSTEVPRAGQAFERMGDQAERAGDRASRSLHQVSVSADQMSGATAGLDAAMTRASVKGNLVADMVQELTRAAVDAAGAFIKLGMAAGDFQDLADMTQASASGLASMKTSADVAGMSIEQIATASNLLSIRLAKVDDDSKGAGKALAAIGIEVEAFKRLRPDEQYRAIAVALEEYGGSANKVVLLNELMGRGGAQHLKVMKDLASQTESTTYLTDAQIQAADNFADSQARVTSQLQQTAQVASVMLIPQIQGLTTVFGEATRELLGLTLQADSAGKNTGIQTFALAATSALMTVVETVGVLGVNVAHVFSEFGRLGAGYAAVVNQLIRGNWEGAKAAGEAYREQGAQADKDLADREARIWGMRGRIEAVRKTVMDQLSAPKGGYALDDFAGLDAAMLKHLDYSTAKVKSNAKEIERERERAAAAAVQQIKQEYQLAHLATVDGLDALDAARKQGLVSELQVIQQRGQFALKDLDLREKQLSAELLIAGKRINAEKEIAQLKGQLAQLDVQRDNINKKMARDTETLLVQQQLALVKAVQDSAVSIEDQADALEAQNKVFGKSKAALLDLTIAQLELSKADLEATDNVIPGYIDALDKKIAGLKRLRAATADGEMLEASKKADEQRLRNWEQTVDRIDLTFHDGFLAMLDKGEGSWDAYTKSLVTTFKSTVADGIYQMFVKPIVLNIVANVAGSGSLGSWANLLGGGGTGAGGSWLSTGSNLYSAYNSLGGFTGAMGSLQSGGGYIGNIANYLGYYNGAGSSFASTVGGGLATDATGATVMEGAASTGAGAGLSGAAYAAGAAAAVGVIAYAAVEAVQSLRGEERGGGNWSFNPATGKSTYLNGPNGGRPEGSDELVTGTLAATTASMNAAFKALGNDLTVSAMQGAWEFSNSGRGGVFSNATFSNGLRIGESGEGSNYDWSSPLNSKYELWGAKTVSGGFLAGAMNSGITGNIDMNGSPEKLATDLQQLYLSAILASVDLVPQLVQHKTQVEGIGQGGGMDTQGLGAMVDVTEWVRDFGAFEAKLSELPASISKLFRDVTGQLIDPELLDAAATQELATKVSTVMGNVTGFRQLVESLLIPAEVFTTVTFDVANAIVEAAGGFQVLQPQLAGFAQNYYDEAERGAMRAKQVTAYMASIGQSQVDTMAEFRAAAEAAAGTDAALFAKYMVVQEAFAQVYGDTAIASKTAQIETLRSSLSAAYEREASGLEQVKAKFLAFAEGFRKWQRDLVAGPQAQLSPYAQYTANQAEYERLLGMLNSGDKAQREEAMTGLQAAGNAFLESSKAYNASSSAYFADLAVVRAGAARAETMARAQVDVAQLQLNALDNLVEGWTTINRSVLSVADLIGQLVGLGATPTAPGGGAAGGGGAGGGNFTSDGAITNSTLAESFVRGWYSGNPNATGADAEGVSYWMAQLAAGRPYQEVKQQFADVVAANTGTAAVPIAAFAAGGRFSGGARLVGEYTPEVEVTGASRIFNAEQLLQMVTGGSGANAATATEMRRQTAVVERQNVLLAELIEAVHGSATSNSEDLRLLKQHLAHVLGKKAVAA